MNCPYSNQIATVYFRCLEERMQLGPQPRSEIAATAVSACGTQLSFDMFRSSGQNSRRHVAHERAR